MSGLSLRPLRPDWQRWPLVQAMRLRVVVGQDEQGQWCAWTAAPTDAQSENSDVDGLTREAVARRVAEPLRWQQVAPEQLAALLSQGEADYQARGSLSGADDDLDALRAPDDARVHELSMEAISRQSSALIRLLDATLFDALKARASDLHLESTATGMVIRHRLDGVMLEVGQVATREVAEQLISRLKVMAELDIGERRLPQDGRFKLRVKLGGDTPAERGDAPLREVDFRVSIMPSSHGEDAVLRILDRTHLSDNDAALSLEGLGFDADDAAQVRRLAAKPYGMLLVTGPTGSGKTTTLYAVVQEINHGQDKIITIEDPVEYQLAGVVQIPVNEKKGLTFARGLRSILRHDPDRVMVGEIRDAETAQIASQAALTGHLVLSTIHANNVFDVVGRFMHMGVDLYNMVSALNGVVAQRLMRRLCVHCAQPWQPQPHELKQAMVPLDWPGLQEARFKRAMGCPHCRGTGYAGRKAISEVLWMDDALRDLIVSRASLVKIKAHARASGTRLLRESGLVCVLKGESSLDELNRVTLAE